MNICNKHLLRCSGVVGFWRAASVGDDVKLFDRQDNHIATLYGIRQQVGDDDDDCDDDGGDDDDDDCDDDDGDDDDCDDDGGDDDGDDDDDDVIELSTAV